MNLQLKDYILAVDFWRVAKVTNTLIYSLKNVEFFSERNPVIVKKSSLPEKYQNLKYTSLKNLYPASILSELLGYSRCYLAVTQKHKFVPIKKIYDFVFVQLNDEFIELCKDGYTPYWLNLDRKESDKKIKIGDLEVGFYK